MLQFTTRMLECARNMETSSFTLPIDIPLIALVKLLNMAEEISSTYALTDGARCTGLPENHISQIINRFKTRLDNWREMYRTTGFNGISTFSWLKKPSLKIYCSFL